MTSPFGAHATANPDGMMRYLDYIEERNKQ